MQVSIYQLRHSDPTGSANGVRTLELLPFYQGSLCAISLSTQVRVFVKQSHAGNNASV